MDDKTRYRIYLMDELGGALIDWERNIEPTAEELQKLSDWDKSWLNYEYHRLDAEWNGHPKGALVAWDGQSVVLITN